MIHNVIVGVRSAALATMALSSAACVMVEDNKDRSSSSSSHSGSSNTAAADAACVAKANQLSAGSGAFVVSSEYSEANTVVVVQDHRGDRYRCLASNDGVVAEIAGI
jgi:hypothetical protein